MLPLCPCGFLRSPEDPGSAARAQGERCDGEAAFPPREGRLPFAFAHTSRKLESGVFGEIYFQLQVKAET